MKVIRVGGWWWIPRWYPAAPKPHRYTLAVGCWLVFIGRARA